MDKNIEALMRRIANGEDPEMVGKEFTDALNKAVKEKNSKSEREKNMSACADRLAEDLKAYVRLAEPGLDEETMRTLDGKAVREILDSGLNELHAIVELKGFFDEYDKNKVKPTKKSPEAILASFLKENGLM